MQTMIPRGPYAGPIAIRAARGEGRHRREPLRRLGQDRA